MLDYKSIIVKRYALNLSGREIAKQIGASKVTNPHFKWGFDKNPSGV